jgi:hypothetical protein
MTTSEIEALLEKFYEGDTTLREEKVLRDFFLGENVPEHLKSHQSMFTYFSAEQRVEIPDLNFEQKLAGQFPEEAFEVPVIRMHNNRYRLSYVTAIAASVLLFIGLFFTFQKEMFNKSPELSGTPSPELVYADASQVLLLVSGNLNHGLQQVEKLQVVEKAMTNMQLFNKFYQYQTIIINPDEILNQSLKSKLP